MLSISVFLIEPLISNQDLRGKVFNAISDALDGHNLDMVVRIVSIQDGHAPTYRADGLVFTPVGLVIEAISQAPVQLELNISKLLANAIYTGVKKVVPGLVVTVIATSGERLHIKN